MNTQECPDITKKNKVRLSRTVEYEGNSIVRNSPIKISDKCDKSLVNMGTLKRDSDAHSDDTSSMPASNSQRQSLSGNKMTANKRLSQRSLQSFLISKPAQSSQILSLNSLQNSEQRKLSRVIINPANARSLNLPPQLYSVKVNLKIISPLEVPPPGPRMDHSAIISWRKNIPLV